LCQKLSKLVEIWQSYDKNNFDSFWDTVYIVHTINNRASDLGYFEDFGNYKLHRTNLSACV